MSTEVKSYETVLEAMAGLIEVAKGDRDSRAVLTRSVEGGSYMVWLEEGKYNRQWITEASGGMVVMQVTYEELTAFALAICAEGWKKDGNGDH